MQMLTLNFHIFRGSADILNLHFSNKNNFVFNRSTAHLNTQPLDCPQDCSDPICRVGIGVDPDFIKGIWYWPDVTDPQ